MKSSHCSRTLALLSLTMLAPVHFAAADNWDEMHWLSGPTNQYQPATTLEFFIDRPGSDYKQLVLTEARPELCRIACFAEGSLCKAFSYASPGQLGSLQPMCYLKSSVPAPQYNPNMISGTTMTNPDQGPYSGQVELLVDRPGMDYRVFTLPEARPELCREACLKDGNNCKSFTYVRPGRKNAEPLCHLKYGVPAPVHEPEHDSGVNTGVPSKMYTAVGTTLELGINRQGEDYYSFEQQEARPEVCREACFDDAPNCKAFTYVRPGLQGTQARCYLKSGFSTPTFNAGTVSGTTQSKREVGLISGLIEMNINRPGLDYRSFNLQEARPELCREACIADAQFCRAFTYVKPDAQGPQARCYLKSGVPAPSVYAGADSGVISMP